MNPINRRGLLKWSAMLAGAFLLGPKLLRAAEPKPRKILFFTKSSGFQHSVIDRHGQELAFAEKIFIDLGKQHSFEVIVSKDGGLFTPEKIAAFDAFVFYTTGDLTTEGADKQPPMSAEGKQALLDAIANGKGFIGIHCATDTFHSQGNQIDPYIAMIGGEFVTHGTQQKSTARVIDHKFLNLEDEKSFTLTEEWYTLKNFADNLHVILLQETDGMKGDMYKRPPYPSTWARAHEKGRVFYTSMGHREDIWTNPLYQNLLLSALNWTTGNVDADVAPNFAQKPE